MPIDAFIHLDRCRCLVEHDGTGHSEPYIWTVLIWVDDTTIGSGRIVGSRAPSEFQGARAVIRAGMRAGQEASLPPVQRSFAHRFEDGLTVRRIGLVVVLLEEDETPDDAVRAAYKAFVRELPPAIADFIRSNGRGPETAAERGQIVAAVQPKVVAAGRDALSAFEKLQVFLGSLDLDDQLAFGTFFAEVGGGGPDDPFTLRLIEGSAANPKQHYEIDGRLELRPPPAPDPCQAQADRVDRARVALDGLQSEIAGLQAELQNASPQEKPVILAQIRQIRRDLIPEAAQALDLARTALARCRALQGTIGPVGPLVVGDPIGSTLETASSAGSGG